MFRRLVPYKSFLISRRSHSFKNNGYVTEFPLSYPEFLHSPVENRRIPLYEKLVRADMLERRLNVDIPEFYVGSILAVTVSDPNMNNRQNRFLGICVRRHKVGLHHTFTLRNVVNGLGVEVMYDLYNPTIRKIETIKLERRLDDDLSYLIDALPEYSTFDFNLEPISHPVGKPVPVNPLKVKLRPPPWSQRWDMLPFEGLENAWEMATPRAKRKVKRTRVNDYFEFDLIWQYRREGQDLANEILIQQEIKDFEQDRQSKGATKRKILRSAELAL
uniref:Large ribosomal subunit protein bL19m n=1 Tax=Bursaphelenchus xylophilus TaxID=6326 RepID=A0A1I7RKV6_BURXY